MTDEILGKQFGLTPKDYTFEYHFPTPETLYIDALTIHGKEKRGKGLGRKIITALLEKNPQVKVITLWATTKSQKYWEHEGLILMNMSGIMSVERYLGMKRDKSLDIKLLQDKLEFFDKAVKDTEKLSKEYQKEIVKLQELIFELRYGFGKDTIIETAQPKKRLLITGIEEKFERYLDIHGLLVTSAGQVTKRKVNIIIDTSDTKRLSKIKKLGKK